MPCSPARPQSLAEFLRVSPDKLLSTGAPPEVEEIVGAQPEAEDIADALASKTGADFCKALVESREYRVSIARRMLLGVLAPAIEGRVLDHTWGRPPERVQVEDLTRKPEDLTAEQLEGRALRLVEMARSIRLAPVSDEDAAEQKTIH